MIDIHAELNEYKKDFISLREFLEVVLKVAGDDYDCSYYPNSSQVYLNQLNPRYCGS
ncbi:hypothetical protein AYR06_18050 [Escherichia albertii]|uniref:hypothetical protein n=1 Tax=Escherichia albertii TaxID=208962 RepID=UPI0013DD9D5A|nr:hypothetical protein [Escherichia albertii]WKU75268.1 hypothetical protein AYR06_18050 [Escherichia albertii]